MSRIRIRPIANVLIASAVIFFLYGLVRIIVELPGYERVTAIATVLVLGTVLVSVIWIIGATRPRD